MGREFPPDVRQFSSQVVEIGSMAMSDVQRYVLKVWEQHEYAAEAYSFNLSDTSGEYPDILTGSISEAKSGVTDSHIFALMLEGGP